MLHHAYASQVEYPIQLKYSDKYGNKTYYSMTVTAVWLSLPYPVFRPKGLNINLKEKNQNSSVQDYKAGTYSK